jgi:lipoprotein-releasing system permease protein
VAALIIVLSVMNGFQKEVRDRMLSAIPMWSCSPGGDALPDWQALAQQARQQPEVTAAAPFIAVQSLLARGEDMRGVMVRGVEPADEGG